MASERPADLDPGELQDYEMVIEEEAFPFEERAIEVHEKNLELMVAGVFNPWIERSLDQLADLMPGRYAKFEISSGFIDSIDRYAYESPRAKRLETGPDAAETGLPAGDPGPARETDTETGAGGAPQPEDTTGEAVATG